MAFIHWCCAAALLETFTRVLVLVGIVDVDRGGKSFGGVLDFYGRRAFNFTLKLKEGVKEGVFAAEAPSGFFSIFQLPCKIETYISLFS
jgi:hypothetical protein